MTHPQLTRSFSVHRTQNPYSHTQSGIVHLRSFKKCALGLSLALIGSTSAFERSALCSSGVSTHLNRFSVPLHALVDFGDTEDLGPEVMVADLPIGQSRHSAWMEHVVSQHVFADKPFDVIKLTDGLPEDEFERADLLEGLAELEHPPHVLLIALTDSAATQFEHQVRGLNLAFQERYGDEHASWPTSAKKVWKNNVKILAKVINQQAHANFDRTNERGETVSARIGAAYQTLTRAGSTVVLAAGNQGKTSQYFKLAELPVPNDFFDSTYCLDGKSLPRGVLIVGSAEQRGGEVKLASYSSPNPHTHVCALGSEVEVDERGFLGSGSSMAAAKVAALAANLISLNRSLVPGQIHDILESTADVLPGSPPGTGAGLVNCLNAYLATRSAS